MDLANTPNLGNNFCYTPFVSWYLLYIKGEDFKDYQELHLGKNNIENNQPIEFSIIEMSSTNFVSHYKLDTSLSNL